MQVRERYDEIEALGAGVVAVATGAVFQAKALMDEGIPFPCLVDEKARLYEALDIGRLGVRQLVDPRTYGKYVAAWRRRGARQGQMTGDPRRLSGLAVFDADARLWWSYVSQVIGEYPPLDDVMDQLRRAIVDP